MVCNESALFLRLCVCSPLQFNQLEGLQQTSPWIRLFHSVVLQKKAVELCQQLYTKVFDSKICAIIICYLPEQCFKFRAFNNLHPGKEGTHSVLNSLA